MLTSDEEVIIGKQYRFVVHRTTGGDPLTFDIDSDTFALLISKWRQMEQRCGERIDLVEFCRRLNQDALRNAEPERD